MPPCPSGQAGSQRHPFGYPNRKQTALSHLLHSFSSCSVFVRNFFETRRRPPKPGRRKSGGREYLFRSRAEEIAKPVEGFPKPARRKSEAGSKKKRKKNIEGVEVSRTNLPADSERFRKNVEKIPKNAGIYLMNLFLSFRRSGK